MYSVINRYDSRSKKNSDLYNGLSRYWQELIDQSYLHQRTSKEGAAMRDLNRSDIVEFHNKFFVQLETTTVYSLYLSSKPVSICIVESITDADPIKYVTK